MNCLREGIPRSILVTAADKRETKAAYFYEMWFGDGAASLLVGNTDVIAEFLGSHSLSLDFIDHYRGSQNKYDYMWEERWVRDEGYGKIIPGAVNGFFKSWASPWTRWINWFSPASSRPNTAASPRNWGPLRKKSRTTSTRVCGETGAAHPLVLFVQALEQAKPGDRILLAGFGQGCDALYFRVTENIKNLPARVGISRVLKKQEDHR